MGKPMTNAERQQKYRERRNADPDRRAEYLKQKNEKYKQDIASGKRKLVKQLSTRESRLIRRQWKLHQRKHRERQRRQVNVEDLTPPQSPDEPGPSHQQITAEKRKKKSQAKCYRDNEDLRKQLDSEKKKTNMYMRRWLRAKTRNEEKGEKETPRKKTRKLLRGLGLSQIKLKRERTKRASQTVKRTLLFHFALSDALKEKYKNEKKNQKKNLSKITKMRIMKKYRIMTKAKEEIGFYHRERQERRKGSLSTRLSTMIKNYFERDDNSQIKGGVKETITRNKVKKQKRLLSLDLQHLHEKFMLEFPDISISYTSFCRLRPFWVLIPSEKDRDTCACKQHENMQMIVDALSNKGLLPSKSLQELVKRSSCSQESYKCMYGLCQKCSDPNVFDPSVNYDINEEISFRQWRTKKEKRVIKSDVKELTITVKEICTDTIGNLTDSFYKALSRFKIHTHNIWNQMNHYRTIRASLKPNEALIHIDFAENFVCKLSREIQSMHFGASQKQLTLHTGVYYSGMDESAHTFCTVSDSLIHGPSGIWAYLGPVLDMIQREVTELDTIHFYSDGPCTQYKQKGNFFLFTKEMSDRRIKHATWNFHESSHGKGIPDGVGASLKRTANNSVLHGTDITSATDFIEVVKASRSKIHVFQATETDVKSRSIERLKLQQIPGTMRLHQIVTEKRGELWFRDLSYGSMNENQHPGQELKFFTFGNSVNVTDSVPVTRRTRMSTASATETTESTPLPMSAANLGEHEMVVEDRDGENGETAEQEMRLEDGDGETAELEMRLEDGDGETAEQEMRLEDGEVETAEQEMRLEDGDGETAEQETRLQDGNGETAEQEMRLDNGEVETAEQEMRLEDGDGETAEQEMRHGDGETAEQETRLQDGDGETAEQEMRLEDGEVETAEQEMRLEDGEVETAEQEMRLEDGEVETAEQEMRLEDGEVETAEQEMRLEDGDGETAEQETRLEDGDGETAEQETRLEDGDGETAEQEKRLENGDGETAEQETRLEDGDGETAEQERRLEDGDGETAEQETRLEDGDGRNGKTAKQHIGMILYDSGNKTAVEQEIGVKVGDSKTLRLEGALEISDCENIKLSNHDNALAVEIMKQINAGEAYFNIRELPTHNFLGKHVIVLYDGLPFPGVVEDIDDEHLYVRCMHRLGTNISTCSFFWPKMIDVDWYNVDSIMGIIPEPTKVGRKFIVPQEIWSAIIHKI